jgi:FMN phosphatase YigB (HAD superfamily)
MERRPLFYLKRCRFEDVDVLFDRLRGRGIKVGAFSDYPIAEKLAALELRAEATAYALEPAIGRLKPHTAVLVAVTERLSIDPGACLVIGDRDERDGACARGLGAQFIKRQRRHLFADLVSTL